MDAIVNLDKVVPENFAVEYLQYLVDIREIYRVLENQVFAHIGIKKQSHTVDLDIQIIAEGAELEIPDTSIPCQSYLIYLTSLTCMSRMAAHVYVRVLADLSGGLILKKRLCGNGYPVQSYEFESCTKEQIISWINTEVEHTDAFMGDVHIAFVSYAAMLK